MNFYQKRLVLEKKMGIYFDEENIIFVISQKSRVLIKDTVKFEEILEKVNSHLSKKFIKKIIIIDSPLCSKAKKELENLKWEVKV